MNKSKYIRTIKNGKVNYSKYEYKNHTYYIEKTGISHIDKYSHEQEQSRIDKLIEQEEYRKTDEYKNKPHYKDDLKDFLKMIDLD